MPTHAEKKILPYTPQQLFDIIADVGHYPAFLPWVESANVYDRQDHQFTADVDIGYRFLTYPYKCRVHLAQPNRIDIEYLTGPFTYLNNHWILTPINDKLTEIDFYIDFEFSNPLLQSVLTPVFAEAVSRMIRAFEARASVLY